MDKKSSPEANQPLAEKIFFIIFFSIAFVVISIAFYKFYILKDYYIKSEADCDPEIEKCFVYECDPAVDTECPENADERLSYYKLIEKKASALPLCDSSSPDCPPIACQEGEDCKELLCDEAAKTQDEKCNDPEEYLKNNPKAEEGEEDVDSDNNQEDTIDENQSQESFENNN